MEQARRHWRPLGKRLGLGDAVFERLAAAYGEPHRHYHNLVHVVEMLDCLEEAGHLAVDRDAVELAIWFHDVIYDSDAPHGANERDSAALLDELCPVPAAKPAHGMILQSIHHGPSADPDTQLFCDLDLYRLSGPLDTFLKHGADVRREYASVSDEDWAAGRAKFFAGMAKRPEIYQTAFWRERLEGQARANLAHAADETS
ncbi:MAG: hypothetical protein AAF942_09265 [Pseudomonadota bacterium]